MATHPSVSSAIDVSAIVITRNEEENIADVLQALLDGLSHTRDEGALTSYEIILADSASTDRTVELAARYPVRIVRLRPHWPLSAAAGRATGARLASGRYLLFVDGDYILNQEWLLRALEVIKRPDVGEVGGVDLEEISGHTVLAHRWAQAQSRPPDTDQDVDTLAVGLVRREIYETIGGFHPFLKGAEDRDFCYRLRAAELRIVRTKEPMGVHRWLPPGKPMTYAEYYRSVARWSLGDGQACRARWSNLALRRRFLGRYGNARSLIQDLQLLAILGLVLANGVSAIVDSTVLLLALTADVVAVAAIERWRRRHAWTWREALYEIQGAIYGPFRQLLFALGVLAQSPPPEQYPTDVEFVKTDGEVAGL